MTRDQLRSLRSGQLSSVSNHSSLYRGFPHLQDPKSHGVCLASNLTCAMMGGAATLSRAYHIPQSPMEYDCSSGRMHLTIFLTGLHRLIGSSRNNQPPPSGSGSDDQGEFLQENEPEGMRISFTQGVRNVEEAREVCEDMARYVLRYPPNMTLLTINWHHEYDSRTVVFLPLAESLQLWIRRILKDIETHQTVNNGDLSSWRPPYKTILQHPDLPYTSSAAAAGEIAGTVPPHLWDQHTYHMFMTEAISPFSPLRTYAAEGQPAQIPIGSCYGGTRHSGGTFHPMFVVVRTAYLHLDEVHPHFDPNCEAARWWRDGVRGCAILTRLCLIFFADDATAQDVMAEARNFIGDAAIHLPDSSTLDMPPELGSDDSTTSNDSSLSSVSGDGESTTTTTLPAGNASGSSSGYSTFGKRRPPAPLPSHLNNLFDEERVNCFRNWLHELQDNSSRVPSDIERRAKQYLQDNECFSGQQCLRPDRLPADFFRALHDPFRPGSVWNPEPYDSDDSGQW
ncbi:unnamed protein product [Sympodiomycopsis kandeliae]